MLVCLAAPALAVDYNEMPKEWQEVRNAFIVSRLLGCLYMHKNDPEEVRRRCTHKALDDSAVCEKKAGSNHTAFKDCLDKLPDPQ
ncbi:MAG: hypothetical protein OHK006_11920 [Thermodesulfovibrionales bacterium]